VDGLDALGEQNLWLKEFSLFLVAILCSDKHFQGAFSARKKEWVKPKISPMDASCTDGGKPYGQEEVPGTSTTPDGDIIKFIGGSS
jgi:hypothetical protein